MPELPEVETIRRQLAERVAGETILEIEVREQRSFAGAPEKFVGLKIMDISRQGKYMYWYTDQMSGLIGHLKMTGRLIIADADSEYAKAKHTRVVIKLSNNKVIYFWDTRKFGYLQQSEDIKADEEKAKTTLGPDPWTVKQDYLIAKAKKTIKPVKEFILDQNILSGVGNIYANDGLWLAGMDPRRKASSLSPKEWAKLTASLKKVMERGLETGGASDNTYVNALGEKGSYQDEFLVYRKTGKPCQRDGQTLKRIVIGGRGTWYCEKCQK